MCASLHKPHPPRLAHFRFDAVFGFQLLNEFIGRKLGSQDVYLAFDGSKGPAGAVPKRPRSATILVTKNDGGQVGFG